MSSDCSDNNINDKTLSPKKQPDCSDNNIDDKTSPKKQPRLTRRRSDVTHLIKKFNKINSNRHSLSLDSSSENWLSLDESSKDGTHELSDNSHELHLTDDRPSNKKVCRRNSDVALLIERFKSLESGKCPWNDYRLNKTPPGDCTYDFDPNTNHEYSSYSLSSDNENSYHQENCNMSHEGAELSRDTMKSPCPLKIGRRDSDVAGLIKKFSKLGVVRHSSASTDSTITDSPGMLCTEIDMSAKKVGTTPGMLRKGQKGCRKLFPEELNYFPNLGDSSPLHLINENKSMYSNTINLTEMTYEDLNLSGKKANTTTGTTKGESKGCKELFPDELNYSFNITDNETHHCIEERKSKNCNVAFSPKISNEGIKRNPSLTTRTKKGCRQLYQDELPFFSSVNDIQPLPCLSVSNYMSDSSIIIQQRDYERIVRDPLESTQRKVSDYDAEDRFNVSQSNNSETGSKLHLDISELSDVDSEFKGMLTHLKLDHANFNHELHASTNKCIKDYNQNIQGQIEEGTQRYGSTRAEHLGKLNNSFSLKYSVNNHEENNTLLILPETPDLLSKYWKPSINSNAVDSPEKSFEDLNQSARKAKSPTGIKAPKGCRKLYPDELSYFSNIGNTYPLPCNKDNSSIKGNKSSSSNLREHKNVLRALPDVLTVPEWAPYLNELPDCNAKGFEACESQSNILKAASKSEGTSISCDEHKEFMETYVLENAKDKESLRAPKEKKDKDCNGNIKHKVEEMQRNLSLKAKKVKKSSSRVSRACRENITEALVGMPDMLKRKFSTSTPNAAKTSKKRP